MRLKNNAVRIILLLALLVIPTGSVLAQGPGGDVVLFGQNYTVQSGDTLQGSLAVFGGNVNVEEDAKVNGDMAVIGGNLSIDGNVNGDIAIIGGNMTITGTVNGEIVVVGGQVILDETAVVEGNISSIGGNVEKKPGAKVTGDITNNAPPTIRIPDAPNPPNLPNVPGIPDVPNPPSINVEVNPFWSVAGKVGQAMGMALIAMLLALFLQPQLERTGDAITSQPLIAGGYGLLSVIVVPAIILVLTLTLILIPIALIVILALPLAWMFGMIALGQEVGNRFTKAIDQTWAPILTIGFGTFLLMLVAGLLQLVPCFGFLAYLLLSFIAIGASAVTVFGTRNMPGPVNTINNPPAIDASASDS